MAKTWSVMDLVPSSKFDTAPIEALTTIEVDAVQPVLRELLEWIRDMNWPVARALCPVLPRFHAGLTPVIVEVLRPEEDDNIWKMWIIQCLLDRWPPESLALVLPSVKRIAYDPTPGERLEGADEAARTLLGSLGHGGGIRPAPRGVRLRSVEYVGFDWDDTGPQAPGFDVVSMGVWLGFENAERFLLRWHLWEPYECLTSGEWAWPLSPMVRTVDASERWPSVVGACVTDQYVGLIETSWGEQPWTCRLDFDNGGSLVVCLGEISEAGTPTYLPDTLLVTGSREHAEAYRPLPAYPSAWVEEGSLMHQVAPGGADGRDGGRGPSTRPV